MPSISALRALFGKKRRSNRKASNKLESIRHKTLFESLEDRRLMTHETAPSYDWHEGECTSCGCGVDLSLHNGDGSLTVRQDGLVYRSSTVGDTVVDFTRSLPELWPNTTPPTLPTKARVELSIDGGMPETFYWTVGSGLEPNDEMLFSLPVNSNASLDRFDWTALVAWEYPGVPLPPAGSGAGLTGTQDYVNRWSSYFGKGWYWEDLHTLEIDDNYGYNLIKGNGEATWFGLGGTQEAGDLNQYGMSIESSGSDTIFTLTASDGEKLVFKRIGTAGQALLQERYDASGNKFEYEYDNGKIETITDVARNQTTTFEYDTSGFLDKITDFAGHLTDVTVSNGVLTNVYQPDPDGTSGPLSSPEIKFSYTGGLITSATDALGNQTLVTYGSMGLATDTVTQITQACGGTSQLAAYRTLGGGGSSPTGAPNLLKASTVYGTFTEGSKVTKVQANRFGQYTSQVHVHNSADDFQTNEEFDTYGRVTRIVTSDPDGALGPLYGTETIYTYDSGNTRNEPLTETIKVNATGGAVLSTQSWEYDPTYSQVTKHVDPLGRVTMYTIGAGGQVTETRRVVGRLDGFDESDDVVTTFTYTTASADPGVPVGLLKTEVSPLGIVTKYEYYGGGTGEESLKGLLKKVSYNAGVPGPANEQYFYDTTTRNLAYMLDVRGGRTDFEYDSLNRLTKETGVDPDGAGAPLARPITQFEYNAVGNLTKTIDPLGNVHRKVYDNRNRVKFDIAPRPTNTAPAEQWIDDAAASFTGSWGSGSGGYGTGHRYNGAGGPTETATWTSAAVQAGINYEIFVTWLANTANAEDAEYSVLDASNNVLATVKVNQKLDPNDLTDSQGRKWERLGVFSGLTSYKVQLKSNATGQVIADAVYLLEVGPTVKYDYDCHGNMTAETDALGNKTSYTYDDKHRLISVTMPDPDAPGGQPAPVTTTEYNADNSVKKEYDALQNATEYKYDEQGRVIEVIQADPDGLSGSQSSPVTKYAYNSAGELTTVIDPMNRVTRYDYDDLRRQTLTISPFAGTSPSTTTLDETANGWSVSTGGFDNDYHYRGQGSASNYTEWSFTVDTSKTYEVLATWQVASNNTEIAPYQIINGSLDVTQRVKQNYAPSDVQTGEQGTTFNWHRLGVFKPTNTTFTVRLRADIEWNKQVVADAVRLVEVGSTSMTSYNAGGNVIQSTDALGNKTITQYDALGRVQAVMEPPADPSVTPFESAIDDLVDEELDWAYIEDSRAVGGGYYRATASSTQAATFDNIELPSTDSRRTYLILATWVPSSQNSNNAVFDTLVGSQFEGTNIVNQQVAPSDYHSSGRWWHILDTIIREPADPAVRVDVYTAGAQADAIKILEVGPSTQTYHDAAGNLTYLIDPINNLTEFAYDGLNRKTSETNPLGKTRSFAYDAAGRLTKETLRHTSVTKTIEHVFDNLGRETQEFWKENTTVVRTTDFGYDTASRMTSVTDNGADARDYVFEHDNLGRNTKTSFHVVNSWGDRHWQFNNTFDSLSRRTLRVTKLSVNGSGFSTVTNDQTDYDNLSRVTLMKQWNTTGVAPKRAEFKYKPDGQYDEIKRFNATTGGTAFVTSSYGYDNAGRLTLLDHKNSAGASITGYAMAYDAANRITSVDFTNTAYAAEDVVYSYDRTDQLTKADRSALDENYKYDENGNRVMTGWVTGLNNQLSEDPLFTYTYDAEGNRTSRVRKSSDPADDKTVLYEWDHKNRLTKVTFKRNDGTITKTIDYVYDAFDRLTRRTMDPDGATGSAALVSNEYLWDGEQLIYMDWIGIAGESRYYMYGPSGEVLFEEVAGNSTLYATLTDHLGTYRDLVNTSGTTVNHIVYDAYGKIVSETTAAPNSPRVRFTGQLYDYQAGLNYHHHRWYDPAAGRWISEDPIGFEGRDANLSRYVSNGATIFVDAIGLAGKPPSGPRPVPHGIRNRVISSTPPPMSGRVLVLVTGHTTEDDFQNWKNEPGSYEVVIVKSREDVRSALRGKKDLDWLVFSGHGCGDGGVCLRRFGKEGSDYRPDLLGDESIFAVTTALKPDGQIYFAACGQQASVLAEFAALFGRRVWGARKDSNSPTDAGSEGWWVVEPPKYELKF
jgi:RHS repeat-associated protein